MSYRNENGKPHPLGDGWFTKILVALIALIAGGTFIYNTVIVGEVDENLTLTQDALERTQTAIAGVQTELPPTSAPTLTVVPSLAPTLTLTSTSTSTATNVPTRVPTREPAPIGTVSVLGSSNTGTEFVVPEDGTYIFRYNSGSYCVYPNPSTAPAPSCLAAVWIFVDGVDFWQGSNPQALDQDSVFLRVAQIYDDCNSGRIGYCATREDVEAKVVGSEVLANLTADTVLRFVAVDDRNAYGDNPGEVLIDVFLR